MITSLARYEKHGRVQAALNKMPALLRAFGQQVMSNFPKLYRKQLTLKVPTLKIRRGRQQELNKVNASSSRSSPVLNTQRKLLKP